MRRILRIAKNMLVLWLGLTLVPLLYYWYVSSKTQDEIHSQLQAQGLQFLSYVDDKAKRIYADIDKTLYEIGHSSLLHDFAHHQDPQLKRYLEKQWYISSLNSSRFDQLRFLDNLGHEVIRVDFPHNAHQPFIVPTTQLQNKAHRDYYLFATSLATNQAGYVGIDLEYEYGKAVLPYKPGFRVIYPIEDKQADGQKRLGYFIANLDVLQLIDDITQNTQQLAVDFIDEQGFYILSSHKNKLFGHLIDERKEVRLAQEKPQLWRQMNMHSNHTGSYWDDDGLYVYQKVTAPLFNRIDDLTLVTRYPHTLVTQSASVPLDLLRLEVSIIWLVLGLVSCISAVMTDTYQRNKLNHAFANLLLENSSAVVLTDSQFQILRANTRFMELTGFSHDQLLGDHLAHFQQLPLSLSGLKTALTHHGYWKGTVDIRTLDQHSLACEVEIRPLHKHKTEQQYYVHSFTDISVHHQRIVELQALSERDCATDLWNKHKFETLLMAQAKLYARYPNQPPSCLAIIDIDDFKSINDSRGHAFGDHAIQYVSAQLKHIMRDSDTVGRIGGDEFAIIIQHVTPSQALKLMHRVTQEIAKWPEHPISISIGLTDINCDWQTSFKLADAALYQAKKSGKNGVVAHEINNVTPIEHHSS